jgi:hypothetical protein
VGVRVIKNILFFLFLVYFFSLFTSTQWPSPLLNRRGKDKGVPFLLMDEDYVENPFGSTGEEEGVVLKSGT